MECPEKMPDKYQLSPAVLCNWPRASERCGRRAIDSSPPVQKLARGCGAHHVLESAPKLKGENMRKTTQTTEVRCDICNKIIDGSVTTKDEMRYLVVEISYVVFNGGILCMHCCVAEG